MQCKISGTYFAEEELKGLRGINVTDKFRVT